MTDRPLRSEEIALLRRARERISDPACWTQGDDARDSSGVPVEAEDLRAVCWCLIGSLFAGLRTNEEYQMAWNVAAFLNADGVELGEFNDRHTHAEVLALMDAALARAYLRKE